MNARPILPALVLLVITAQAVAVSSDGSFSIKGYGALKCSEYVAQIDANNEVRINRYTGWLAGYFTASNEISPDTFDYLSWQNLRTLSLMLMKHCQLNPEERFATAVARLRNALKTNRLASQSPMVKITVGKNTLYIYQESLRSAQHKLQQAGYKPGPVDGQYGEATAGALKKFQERNKLPVTGIPDQPTLYLLMFKKK